MENNKKFEELMQNENFVMKILDLQNLEDMAAEFEKNGVKISNDKLKKLGDELETIRQTVAEEDLDNISGGGKSYSEIIKDKFGDGLGEAAMAIPVLILLGVVATAMVWWKRKMGLRGTSRKKGKTLNINIQNTLPSEDKPKSKNNKKKIIKNSINGGDV